MRTFIYLTIVVWVMDILDLVVTQEANERVETFNPEIMEVAVKSESEMEEQKMNDDRNEMDPSSSIGVEDTELLTVNGGNLMQNEKTVNEFGENAGYLNGSQSSDVSLSRKRRDTCAIPKDEHAKFDCTLGENYTKCTQTCVWGYKVENQTEIERTCSSKSSEWCPEFQKCEADTKCQLRLVSPGEVSCTTNYMDHGPNCTVTCEKTKKNPAVKPYSVECKEGGTWDPKIPHCVRSE